MDYGADINLHNKFNGNTPLIEASEGGFMEVVVFLVESGADMDDVNNVSRDGILLCTQHYMFLMLGYVCSSVLYRLQGWTHSNVPLQLARRARCSSLSVESGRFL